MPSKRTKKSNGKVHEPASSTGAVENQVEVAQSETEAVSATIVESTEVEVFSKVEDQEVEQHARKKPKQNKRPYVEYVSTQCLENGLFDRKELIKAIMEKFSGLSKGGVETFVTDLKNPKYSFFKERAVILHPKTGKLIFADKVEETPPETATNEIQATEEPSESPGE